MAGHDGTSRAAADASASTSTSSPHDASPPCHAAVAAASQDQPALSRNERKRRFREEQAALRVASDGAAAGAARKKPQPLRMPASAFVPLGAELVQRHCVVAYDGSLFQGFQAQEQREAMRTVQETIEDALLRTTGEVIRLRAASRTDAGVHARGQVVAFASRCALDDRAFRDALNNRLPDDVLCRSMTRTAEHFDPRAHSKRKTYVYAIANGGLRPVFDRQRVWFVKKPLDVHRMNAAVAYFLEAPVAKDYSSFSPQKALLDTSNVCTISSITISVEPATAAGLAGVADAEAPANVADSDAGRRLELVFQGDRFLYKMVRNLVGTLVDVGLGRIAPESIPAILQARSRAKAGQGAPPQGLTLVHIDYSDK